MRQNLVISTEGATICVFDPVILETYSHPDLNASEFGTIQGVSDGLFFGFDTGRDGVYRVQATDEGLIGNERDYACNVLETLGLKVVSGTVCFGGYGFQGGSEYLPSIHAAPGQYLVSVFEVLRYVSAQWHLQDANSREDAPCDYVVSLTPGEWPGPSAVANIENFRLETVYSFRIDESPPFLFAAAGRSVGTPPGTVLVSTAISSPSYEQGYYLKECGVEGYKVELDRYPDVRWKDRVQFEVVSVDHDIGRIHGRFLRRL